jgi:hypothetical protein
MRRKLQQICKQVLQSYVPIQNIVFVQEYRGKMFFSAVLQSRDRRVG